MKRSIVAITLALLSTVTSAATYLVEPDDTFLGIANRAGISGSELARLNGKPVNYMVKTGEAIRVPKALKQKYPTHLLTVPDETFDVDIAGQTYIATRKNGKITFAAKEVKHIEVNKEVTLEEGKFYKYVTPTGKTEIFVIEK